MLETFAFATKKEMSAKLTRYMITRREYLATLPGKPVMIGVFPEDEPSTPMSTGMCGVIMDVVEATVWIAPNGTASVAATQSGVTSCSSALAVPRMW